MAAIQWQPGAGKTWRQKLEQPHPNHGKVLPVPPRMQQRWGTGTMLIPRPLDVDAAMRLPREGEVLTLSQLRAKLARDGGAERACPLTTGIFVRVAAEAAEEDRREGRKRITPYWRTIRDDGSLNDKFPGGTAAQARRLREEGLAIEPGKGRRSLRVRDFDQHLVHVDATSPRAANRRPSR